jgi:hypothetical protein
MKTPINRDLQGRWPTLQFAIFWRGKLNWPTVGYPRLDLVEFTVRAQHQQRFNRSEISHGSMADREIGGRQIGWAS